MIFSERMKYWKEFFSYFETNKLVASVASVSAIQIRIQGIGAGVCTVEEERGDFVFHSSLLLPLLDFPNTFLVFFDSRCFPTLLCH